MTKTTGKRGAAKSGDSPEPLLRRLRPLLRVLGVVAIVFVLAAGLYALRHRMRSASPHSLGSARVRLVGVPRWLAGDIARGILADIRSVTAGEGRARSLLDDGLARDVYRRAAANPWISRVRGVSKNGAGGVSVRADYRRPFALVRSAKLPVSTLTVVDRAGVVLPLPAGRIKP
ncbi:hypothetical protein LCGC14_2404170, partial [marine sediment metagenome]